MSQPPPETKAPNLGRFKKTQDARRNYIENRTIGGMNKTDAALAAGFSPSMARNASSRIETPEVLAAIDNLDKALVTRIPTEILVEKFAEGLDATIVKIVQLERYTTDTREFPDYPTRLRYLEKIALISRRYQPKSTTEHTGKDGGPIELTALTNEQLKQRIQQLERELGVTLPGRAAAGTLPPPQGRPKAR